MPRFHQRLSDPRTGGLRWPRWVDDERFDIAHHVRAAALPRPAGEAELREWAGEYFSHAPRPGPAAVGDRPRRARRRPLGDGDQDPSLHGRRRRLGRRRPDHPRPRAAIPGAPEIAAGRVRPAGPHPGIRGTLRRRGLAALAAVARGLRHRGVGAVRARRRRACRRRRRRRHPPRARRETRCDARARSPRCWSATSSIAAPPPASTSRSAPRATLAVIEVPLDELKEIKRVARRDGQRRRPRGRPRAACGGCSSIAARRCPRRACGRWCRSTSALRPSSSRSATGSPHCSSTCRSPSRTPGDATSCSSTRPSG